MRAGTEPHLHQYPQADFPVIFSFFNFTEMLDIK